MSKCEFGSQLTVSIPSCCYKKEETKKKEKDICTHEYMSDSVMTFYSDILPIFQILETMYLSHGN